MDDTQKTCLGFAVLISAICLPISVWAIGWIAVDLRTGTLMAVAALPILLTVSFVFMASTNLGKYIVNSLPFVFSSIYTLLWDPIIGPLDDFFTLIIGGFLTYSLFYINTPKELVGKFGLGRFKLPFGKKEDSESVTDIDLFDM